MRVGLLALAFALLGACSGPRAVVRDFSAEKRRGLVAASVDPTVPLPSPLVEHAQALMTERCGGAAKVSNEGVTEERVAPRNTVHDPFDRDMHGRSRPMFRQWDREARVAYVYLWEFTCVEQAAGAPPQQ